MGPYFLGVLATALSHLSLGGVERSNSLAYLHVDVLCFEKELRQAICYYKH